MFVSQQVTEAAQEETPGCGEGVDAVARRLLQSTEIEGQGSGPLVSKDVSQVLL
jgi:hypothetical protein